MSPDQKRFYSLADAAQRCGYRRPNTFREKHLSTPSSRQELLRGYNSRGGLMLDVDAVNRLADELELQRFRKGNWRLRNLGPYGRKRAPDSVVQSPMQD